MLDCIQSESRSSVKKQIQPVRCGTFITQPIERPEPMIEGGILPRKSILVVGGISKAGKSIFVANLGLQIAAGLPFLGQFAIPKRRHVLYMQAEMSESSMQDRLTKMIKAQPIDHDILNQNFILINHKGIKLDDKSDLDRISGVIAQYGIEVVIIDPLYKFHRGDENRVDDMTRFFDNLDSLVMDHDCSIVIVHHFGKPNERKKQGAQQLRGSSVIFDLSLIHI